jgi:hypothetical protein
MAGSNTPTNLETSIYNNSGRIQQKIHLPEHGQLNGIDVDEAFNNDRTKAEEERRDGGESDAKIWTGT